MSDPTLTDVLKTVADLAEAIKNKGRPELWTTQQIAAWWGVHENTVYREAVCREDFPKAIQISDTGTKRWVADEIVQWFLQHRAKVARRKAA